MNKVPVSWKVIENMVDKIVDQVKLSKVEYNSIYGVSRGGLVPAVILSHKLGLPLITDMNNIDNILVVDDISDRGNTMLEFVIMNATKEFDVATLFCRSDSLFTPRFTGETIYSKLWFIFPWENFESSKYDNI